MPHTPEGLPRHQQHFSPLPEYHVPFSQLIFPIFDLLRCLQPPLTILSTLRFRIITQFVNEAFMLKNKLKFSYLLKAILLRMFDGSTTSTVDRTCHIPITFSTGELHVVDLFVTKLDEEYSVVLGYDWLTQHNPSIDWLEMKITFCNPKTPLETPSPAPKVIDI